MVDTAILDANAEATRRLGALIDRLTDADLARDLGGGWTIAVALGHAAFWDRRAIAEFERWVRDGTPYRDQDDDIINEALEEGLRAIPHRRAAELALEAALAVDAVVAALPDAIAAAVIADGFVGLMRRANHRIEHVDQIETELNG